MKRKRYILPPKNKYCCRKLCFPSEDIDSTYFPDGHDYHLTSWPISFLIWGDSSTESICQESIKHLDLFRATIGIEDDEWYLRSDSEDDPDEYDHGYCDEYTISSEDKYLLRRYNKAVSLKDSLIGFAFRCKHNNLLSKSKLSTTLFINS